MDANLAFSRYETDIVAKAKKYLIPGLDWDDVAQELRITLWRKLPQYKPSRASERTFADRIMQRRLIDLHRTAERKKRYHDNHHDSFDAMMESGYDLSDGKWIHVDFLDL